MSGRLQRIQYEAMGAIICSSPHPNATATVSTLLLAHQAENRDLPLFFCHNVHCDMICSSVFWEAQ